MRRLISSALVLLCFVYFAPPALAGPITVDFTARVTSIIDYGGHLGSVVRVDDTITGRYLYESTTPDTNSLATVGDYWHREAPFGISLDVNGLVFRTDPTAVRFLVEVVDNHAAGDQYLLGSYTNIFPVSVPPSDRPPFNEIFWVLRDSLGAALDNSALPTQPPTLADWPARTLRITSENFDEAFFVIDAEITSVRAAVPEPVPEPASLLLFGTGLVGLRARRKRRQ